MFRLVAALALLALAACRAEGLQAETFDRADGPAYSHRERATTTVDGGAEDVASAGLETVPLGWFGPDDPDQPLTGGMWSAACMAIEEANARGGWRGRAFELVAVWSAGSWGNGARSVTRLVYEHHVRALAGAPDGASAHLVEQITAKARLPFVNPTSTDKSANLAGVPWIFSCAPGDHLLAPLLAGALVEAAAGGPIALISCTDHDSRQLVRELLTALDARGEGPDLHLELRSRPETHAGLLDALNRSGPAALGLIAGPLDSAHILRILRGAGLTQTIVGGPGMGRRGFAQAAGPAAEGVRFPLLWDPESVGAPADAFSSRFTLRSGLEPDHADAFAYDSVHLIIAAIEQAGLDRARIGEALRALAPYEGVSGPVVWDRTGHNTRPVPLGTWRQGKRVPISE